MMKQELSKRQKEIAFFNEGEGSLLVLASAGSGKTRILTERVRYLLTEKKDKYFFVLCLTFTNKAAKEMNERLSDIPKLSERAFIGTFHEFCLNRIIHKQGHEIGLNVIPHIFEKDEDRKDLLVQVIRQKKSLKKEYRFNNTTSANERNKAQQELLSHYINFISNAKRNLITIPDHVTKWKKWGKKKTFLYKEYNQLLQNQNAMDYDDILLYAYRILTERPAVAKLFRRLYKYILIDEAQDLNFAQYSILKAMCGETHRNVMMTGDSKQAIYAFNGASVDFMQKEFVADFEAETKKVEKNYRSSSKVLDLARHIRPNGKRPKNFFTGVCKIKPFEDEGLEAKWIVDKIKKWLEKGSYNENETSTPIGLKDIAVIGRNRYIFKKLINLLEQDSQLKNSFYLKKSTEQFQPESQLFSAFDLGLRILVNPSDKLHFSQLYQELDLEEPHIKNRLQELLLLNKTKPIDPDKELILDILTDAWSKLNNNQKLVHEVLEQIRKSIESSAFPDEEKSKIVYDIDEYNILWLKFLRNTPYKNQTLANFRYFLALNGKEGNQQGLTLTTIHTAKGLDFEIVFLLGMNQGVLPDYRAKDKQARDEERNNAYVAVTRAKKCIYISYPESRKMPWGNIKSQKISSFIEDFKM